MEKILNEPGVYLTTLKEIAKGNASESDLKLIEDLISKHFSMLDHMKKTALMDVYEYEQRISRAVVEPMSILAYENEKLKKEVNRLRRELGKIDKYKES